MAIQVYQYAKCSTCRKALGWLDGREIAYEAIPIVEAPPSKTALRKLWKRSGLPLQKLFNTSGQSYRQGGFKEKRSAMSDDELLAALAADGKLIKRPILVVGDDGPVLVGFKEADYEAAFS